MFCARALFHGSPAPPPLCRRIPWRAANMKTPGPRPGAAAHPNPRHSQPADSQAAVCVSFFSTLRSPVEVSRGAARGQEAEVETEPAEGAEPDGEQGSATMRRRTPLPAASGFSPPVVISSGGGVVR